MQTPTLSPYFVLKVAKISPKIYVFITQTTNNLPKIDAKHARKMVMSSFHVLILIRLTEINRPITLCDQTVSST